MPTPFYHLRIAEDLLEANELNPKLRLFLEEQRSAFLLGHVAPDVQAISGQPRKETHFFDLPLRFNRMKPWQKLLSDHPALASSVISSPARTAFLIGYLCHLLADWYWVSEIFVPNFGLFSKWGVFSQRQYLHNVLRAYLDREYLADLANGTADSLLHAQPDHWLPFVGDVHLIEWRDSLARQLQPGARVYTVEVFSNRQGISPDHYYRILDSEDEMEKQIFSHVPRLALKEVRDKILTESRTLVADYLGSLPGGHE